MKNHQNTRFESQRMLNHLREGNSLQPLYDICIWMNTKEASNYLRISVPNLRLKVHRGQIKAYKLGSRLRFKKQELDDLLESSLIEGD